MKSIAISLFVILSLLGNMTQAIADENGPVMEMVVIPLKYRSAEDAVALLKPFMHPGGVISGTGYTLVIRSTAKNITDLKEILADFDTALKRLQISVSYDRQYVLQDMQTDAKVTATNGNISGQVHVQQTRRRQDVAGVQRLQVVQGQWANIQAGKQFPVTQRRTNPDGTVTESVTYQHVSTGFQVFPQIADSTVILKIRPFHSAMSREGQGQINSQSLETTVSAPLGTWVELGGIIQKLENGNNSSQYSTGPRGEAAAGLFLKVDLIH